MNKTVFIIDDDPFFHFIMKKGIKKIDEHIDIRFYSNGSDALNVFRSIIAENAPMPRVVLLDINMPVLDGWQVLDELVKLDRQLLQHTDIYMCSTSLDPHDKIRAHEYNIVKGFLVKKVNQDVLEKIVASMHEE